MAKAKNVKKPSSLIVKSRLPLVNPETLFSHGVWENVFQFIFQYLDMICGVSNGSNHLTVTFRDLYFLKWYTGGFSYPIASSKLDNLGRGLSYHIMENNDRDNEPCIGVETLGLSLYKYHDHTCLSLGGSTVSNSCCWGGPESSDRQVVLWDMTIDEFLKTVYFIESVLSGKGSPYLCRAYFEVGLDFAKVLVKAFYGQHVLMPSNSTRGDEVQWKLRKYYVPKFEICFL